MGSYFVGLAGLADLAGLVHKIDLVGWAGLAVVGKAAVAVPAGCCSPSWGTVRCNWSGCWQFYVLLEKSKTMQVRMPRNN